MFTQRGAASQGWGLGQLTNGSRWRAAVPGPGVPPRTAPTLAGAVDGGSLPSHRGLDDTTFLLYCSLCAVYLYLLALYHSGEEAGGWGRLGRADKENNHQDARKRNQDLAPALLLRLPMTCHRHIMHVSFTKTFGCSMA